MARWINNYADIVTAITFTNLMSGKVGKRHYTGVSCLPAGINDLQ